MTEQINKQLLDKAKLALADWDAPLTVDYPHDLGARMVELGQAIAAAEQALNAERAYPSEADVRSMFREHDERVRVADQTPWQVWRDAFNAAYRAAPFHFEEQPKPEGFGDMFELDELVSMHRAAIWITARDKDSTIGYEHAGVEQANKIKAHVRKMLDEVKVQSPLPKLLGYLPMPDLARIESFAEAVEHAADWNAGDNSKFCGYKLKVVAIYEIAEQ